MYVPVITVWHERDTAEESSDNFREDLHVVIKAS